MRIWTKRTAGLSALIGGLLVAASVGAHASDLPLVSGLPLVGNAQQAAAVPQQVATPQMSSSNPGRVVIGNGSGTKTITSTGDTSAYAPVNDCANPVNDVPGIATAAQCRNQQNHIAVHHAG